LWWSWRRKVGNLNHYHMKGMAVEGSEAAVVWSSGAEATIVVEV
jgi:hypothetical protein